MKKIEPYDSDEDIEALLVGFIKHDNDYTEYIRIADSLFEDISNARQNL